MVCIYCNNETRVTNSRPQKRTNGIWRRRNCMSCGTTFTSIESADLSSSITVSSNSQSEAFQRDKLFISIYDSLQHRKTAQMDATGLTDTIIRKLYPYAIDLSIEATTIITITYQTLQRFDKAAATHYKAFHPTNKFNPQGITT